MTTLHNILNFALHLANMQTSDRELLLQFPNGVNIKFEVQFGTPDCGADLGQVSEQVGKKFGDTFALMSGEVAQLLQLGSGAG